MNLRDLEYLVAVAKHRNFHKAAKACFVSQPTLSAQLKKLEEYLNVTLIERNPGNIMVTEIGEQILQRAQQIVQLSEDIKQVAKEYGDIYSSSMQLGLIPTIAPYLLPRVSKKMKKAFPELDIRLHELQTQPLLKRLKEGKLDVVIMALPVEETLDGLYVEDLYSEPFYLAVNAGHPLAKRKRLAVNELKDLKIVLLERGHCMRDHAGDLCERLEAEVDELFTATSLETLRHMITVNEAMTLMPELAIEKETDRSSNIAYIPFSGEGISRRIVMAFRKSSHKQAVFLQLAKLICETVT